MLAALASHSGSLGGLSSLAGSLLGGHTTTALFVNLLHSSTVSGHLIDRFHLQHVYRKRYRIDTAKHLAHLTSIKEDKKSGVITIEVEDQDPVRARDLTQGYLDELDKLVMRTNTSAAHREHFIERRLHSPGGPRTRAAEAQPISSTTSTSISRKTRAMVDAGARVQGELLVEQSGLQSLRQIYGDRESSRARAGNAMGSLNASWKRRRFVAPLSAAAAGEVSAASAGDDKGELYHR